MSTSGQNYTHNLALLVSIIPLFTAITISACGDHDDDDVFGTDDTHVETEADLEPVIDTDDMTIYFPRRAENGGVDPTDEPAPGTLTLDNDGCLRLGVGGPVIIWPNQGYDVQLRDGEVALIDERHGSIIYIGDDIMLSGTPSSPSVLEGLKLADPLPEHCADADSFLVTGGTSQQ